MQELKGGRVALGSVQWGVDYGIANQFGQPSIDTVSTMMLRAKVSGINFIDTAPAYGIAEEIIGGVAQNSYFNIVTKTLPYDQHGASSSRVKNVIDGFLKSLGSLKRDHVYGLLIHHAEELFLSHGIKLWESLLLLKSKGLVQKIGVSVYDPNQLIQILDKFKIDLVQLPLNLYDQRFIHSGLLAQLKSIGIEIHVRSALLQGALVVEPLKLPNHLSLMRPLQAAWHERCRVHGITTLAAAIGFCLKQPEVDKVILGCESLSQLEEIIAASEVISNVFETDCYAIEDPEIIDPRRWGRKI